MPTQPQTSTPSSLDPQAVALAQSIRQVESNNNPTAVGKSGEYGAYQWEPATWDSMSKAADVDVPLQQSTIEQQNQVAYTQIKKWKDAGYNVGQIASMWNAGAGAPNAYQTGNKGINGEGVGYDTPAYAKKVAENYQQLKTQGSSNGLQPPVQSGQNPTQPSNTAFGGALQPPTPPSTPIATNQTNPVTQPTMAQNATSALGAVGNFLFPIVGDIGNDIAGKSNKTFLQQTGDAALSALPFVPGLGEAGEAVRGAGAVAEGIGDTAQAAKSTGLLSKLAGSTVAKNAALGYGAGVASNLSGGKSIGQSILPGLNTIGGAVIGGGTAGLLKGLTGGGTGLADSATKDITDVLAPTTKANKAITQDIAPRLAKEGIIAGSREGLLAKYEANMGKASEALEAGYDALPSDAKFEVTNLFDGLQKKIDDLTVNGSIPSAAQAKVNAYQGMMRDLANIGVETSSDGTKVFADVANVRKLRQIVDEGTKDFKFSDLDKASAAAKKQLGNSIRSEFAKQYPDIAKLNKDFSFWSKASSVLSDAIERKTGQTGLIRKGIGAGLGMAAGSSAGHPVIGSAVGKLLSDFVSSPAWHTTSALLKSKLAGAIEKGDSVEASKIIQLASKTAPILGSLGVQGLLNSANSPQK